MFKLYKTHAGNAYPYLLIYGKKALLFDLKHLTPTLENVAKYGWDLEYDNFTENLICKFETTDELYDKHPELFI